MAPRAANTLTGLIYVGPRATHFSLLGILVHGLYGIIIWGRGQHIYNAICIYGIDIRQATEFVNGVLKYCSVVDGIVKST
jgi:hypothetical protein